MQPQTLHGAFARQVAETPDAVAVQDPHGTIRYGELERRADALARRIGALDTSDSCAPRIAAVYLNRSIDFIVAVLAILKAGGAYLPLDVSYPIERLAYMLEDSGAEIAITDAALLPDLPRSKARALLIGCDESDGIDEDSNAAAMPDAGENPPSLAYVIYTSGSTGMPKGVMCTHAGIMNRLCWMRETFDVAATDRVLQKTPASFDVSIWEMFLPLISGACAVLAKPDGHLDPPYMARLIERECITISHFLPSMLQRFLDTGGVRGFRSLRHAFCGGETLFPRTVEAFMQQSDAPLHNVYGPTEASIGVTCWHATARDDGIVPIGSPISNVRIYILDKNFHRVEGDATGEICIGGVQLARGYLNRPELTAEKFVDGLASTGERIYRTGDLGRWLDDGSLEFLGRIDHQVKLNGYRIEIGEIEATLMRHGDVRQAVATVWEANAQSRLVGYVASDKASSSLVPELLTHLRRHLPHYMVPSRIMVMDALPVEPNGKVSRQGLPKPSNIAVKEEEEDDYVDPASGDNVEVILKRIWGAVLAAPAIGRRSDFFLSGGTSLAASSVVQQVNRAFGTQLPVRTLFEHPTIEALAARLRAPQVDPHYEPLVTLKQGEGVPPLYCVHPVGGTAFRYKALADRLPVDVPVFGIQASGLEAGETLASSVEAMASRYKSAIRAVQPHGPYRVLGWSFGGLVAYELAAQLESEGEEISLLALLDTPVPSQDHGPPGDAAAVKALANQLLDPASPHRDVRGEIATLEDLVRVAQFERAVPAEFNLAHAQRLARLVRNCISIGRRYVPQPIDVQMLYVRATVPMPGLQMVGESFDWSLLLSSDPITVELACTHLGLGQPAMASTLAEVLSPLL
ncbi:amino acid adenylation domain-containing protein [Variovorax sp. ZS18.2.2]|uniref:amino acid adenylation domain-containing protein n=1 Tax=Variovorax sp. ZS18.2.2 TaxID=2971255 RepID=UPI0021519FFF|nr:amino acid adenylation domain-containing protein [Variovorax sp. ZS18.2.2]MCR6480882.1 amino acid adenylation domain-containing protein [Variovorax sp. ZS18.2.2]